MEKLLSVDNLVKDYTSGVETLQILKGVSFKMDEGASVAITGRSGSGKSTLLNILGGLDKSDSGSVRIRGEEITGLSEKNLSLYRSRDVGFIFQFHYLLKDFTAIENVMLPAYMSGVKKKDAMEKARVLLADVKLSDRVEHFPSQLSGGERQRVAVARSLVNDPVIILADEPTGNLDSVNSCMVAEILYDTTIKWGKSLIVVTHDERVASRSHCRYALEDGILKRVASV
ncbi:MAG: ABC transporter ATP-binding protein [Treponema sp.]|jgi:lipoprotein-releasing system ATP-binding protein|nr:ABC transporter ATP-binding protein [Treponema sp.]